MVASILARLVRTGLRKGLRDGSRPWLYVGVAAGSVSLLRRVAARRPETLLVTELQPGETLQISAAPSE